MRITNIDARITLKGDYELILMVPRSERAAIESLLEEFKNKADKAWQVVVSIVRQKRSLDANAYMWVLCDKIADKLGSTKIEVYRTAIKQVGVFDALLMKDKAVESFIAVWDKQGIGNYAEAAYPSPAVAGCTTVHAYRGSSLYDSKQMSRLIEHIVEEAQAQGIETQSPAELERLVSLWEK